MRNRVKWWIKDVKDWWEFKHDYVDMDSDEADELGRAYHDHKVRVRDAGRPGGTGQGNAPRARPSPNPAGPGGNPIPRQKEV